MGRKNAQQERPRFRGQEIAEDESIERGLDDLSVKFVDGACALLTLGSERRLVRQADLQNAIKALAKGAQQTY